MPQVAEEPVAEKVANIEVAAIVTDTPVFEPEPVIVAEVVVTAVPPVATEPSAPIDVSANLADAGLVMIETAAEKAQSAAPIELPKPQLGRKPKAPVLVADEPLQMVETHRD